MEYRPCWIALRQAVADPLKHDDCCRRMAIISDDSSFIKRTNDRSSDSVFENRPFTKKGNYIYHILDLFVSKCHF